MFTLLTTTLGLVKSFRRSAEGQAIIDRQLNDNKTHVKKPKSHNECRSMYLKKLTERWWQTNGLKATQKWRTCTLIQLGNSTLLDYRKRLVTKNQRSATYAYGNDFHMFVCICLVNTQSHFVYASIESLAKLA